MGLCLWPYSGPRGWALFCKRCTPAVLHCLPEQSSSRQRLQGLLEIKDTHRPRVLR